MNYRIEKDTLGEIQVANDKYWGAQTQRSLENFPIGPEASMPMEIIHGFAYLKKAAAITNNKLGLLSNEKSDLIGKAC
ncbi:MAG: class II fumarate hydratase, partial [Bacteroidales bacterium]|nr:class II fumarate hydratase [Bacteroidales bacterium]